MRLEGHIDVVRPDLIAGWARDADAPGDALDAAAKRCNDGGSASNLRAREAALGSSR